MEIGYKKVNTDTEPVETTVEEKDKKIKGKPCKKAKKSAFQLFKESFIAEEIGDLKEYVVKDVIVPMIKDSICDGISNSLSMMLYGEKRNYRRSSYYDRSSSGVRYYNYSSQRYSSKGRERDERHDDRRYATPASFDMAVARNMDDAKDILDEMADIYDDEGCLSIAQYHQCCELPTTPEEHNWGWYSLVDVKLKEDRSTGEVLIWMPKAVSLK